MGGGIYRIYRVKVIKRSAGRRLLWLAVLVVVLLVSANTDEEAKAFLGY